MEHRINAYINCDFPAVSKGAERSLNIQLLTPASLFARLIRVASGLVKLNVR